MKADATWRELENRVTPLPGAGLEPPAYGAAQREAIYSVVDSLTTDICSRVGKLRKQLDDIEQLVLEHAAKSKQGLDHQIVLCVRLSDEIDHTQNLIADLKELANPDRP